MPCHLARARQVLKKGKAAVYRRFPFTIILKEIEGKDTQPTRLKFDPDSRSTSIALVASFQRGSRCIWAAELTHRGFHIKKALFQQRRATRCSRRSRKTLYRQPRFLNRTHRKGFLPPSLQSRVDNIASWTNKLSLFVSITLLSMELVRFGLQAIQHPEISGKYLLDKSVVTKGKKKGKYLGRDAVRSSGSFNITTTNETIQGIRYKLCPLLQFTDGYAYTLKERSAAPTLPSKTQEGVYAAKI